MLESVPNILTNYSPAQPIASNTVLIRFRTRCANLRVIAQGMALIGEGCFLGMGYFFVF